MPKNQKIIKALPVSIVELNEEAGIVDAIVSVFGNMDSQDDIIQKGAFQKTITENIRNIRVLDNHNTDSVLRVVGRVLELREVGAEDLPGDIRRMYPEATGGLFTSTQFFMDTPEGLGVFKRIKAGGVNQYSIGFNILKSDFEKITKDDIEIPVRIIREVKLWEYSVVIWGANDGTSTVDAKSDEAEFETAPESQFEGETDTRPDDAEPGICTVRIDADTIAALSAKWHEEYGDVNNIEFEGIMFSPYPVEASIHKLIKARSLSETVEDVVWAFDMQGYSGEVPEHNGFAVWDVFKKHIIVKSLPNADAEFRFYKVGYMEAGASIRFKSFDEWEGGSYVFQVGEKSGDVQPDKKDAEPDFDPLTPDTELELKRRRLIAYLRVNGVKTDV